VATKKPNLQNFSSRTGEKKTRPDCLKIFKFMTWKSIIASYNLLEFNFRRFLDAIQSTQKRKKPYSEQFFPRQSGAFFSPLAVVAFSGWRENKVHLTVADGAKRDCVVSHE
jgi:hypothetical protein